MPIDDDSEAAASSRRGRREQREVRKGGAVDDVIALAVSQEMAEHTEPSVWELLHQVLLDEPRDGGAEQAAPRPYRGLQSFDAEHADLFFGRDQLQGHALGRYRNGDRVLTGMRDADLDAAQTQRGKTLVGAPMESDTRSTGLIGQDLDIPPVDPPDARAQRL